LIYFHLLLGRLAEAGYLYPESLPLSQAALGAGGVTEAAKSDACPPSVSHRSKAAWGAPR
jgi:hypothetical protein